MPLDRTQLLSQVPRQLMAENRDWTADIDTVLENANRYLLERIHPDFLKAGIERSLALGVRSLDLTDLALSELRTLTCRGPYGTAPILARTLDFCRALFPDDRQRDEPLYYAETETRGRFELFPFPVRGYPYLVGSNRRIPPLTLWLFCSSTHAGQLTPGAPNSQGQYVNPVGLALDASTLLVLPWRAARIVNPAPPGAASIIFDHPDHPTVAAALVDLLTRVAALET